MIFLRKAAIAAMTVIFNQDAAFQLGACLLVILVALGAQVRQAEA